MSGPTQPASSLPESGPFFGHPAEILMTDVMTVLVLNSIALRRKLEKKLGWRKGEEESIFDQISSEDREKIPKEQCAITQTVLPFLMSRTKARTLNWSQLSMLGHAYETLISLNARPMVPVPPELMVDNNRYYLSAAELKCLSTACFSHSKRRCLAAQQEPKQSLSRPSSSMQPDARFAPPGVSAASASTTPKTTGKDDQGSIPQTGKPTRPPRFLSSDERSAIQFDEDTCRLANGLDLLIQRDASLVERMSTTHQSRSVLRLESASGELARYLFAARMLAQQRTQSNLDDLVAISRGISLVKKNLRDDHQGTRIKLMDYWSSISRNGQCYWYSYKHMTLLESVIGGCLSKFRLDSDVGESNSKQDHESVKQDDEDPTDPGDVVDPAGFEEILENMQDLLKRVETHQVEADQLISAIAQRVIDIASSDADAQENDEDSG